MADSDSEARRASDGPLSKAAIPATAVQSEMSAVPTTSLPRVVTPQVMERRYQGSGTYPLWGGLGEQTLGFLLGELGIEIVIGPGGAAGKDASAKGLDLVGPRVKTSEVFIFDNKSFGVPTTASSASALTSNFVGNLDNAIAEIEAQAASPARELSLEKLRELRQVVGSGGGPVPDGVHIVISGAGGYLKGISPSLQEEFFKASGLTNPDGTPYLLELMPFTTEAEMAAKENEIARAEAVGEAFSRARTGAVVLEAVNAETYTKATAPRMMPGEWDGAFLMGLDLIKRVIHGILRLLNEHGIILNETQREFKRVWPKIVEKMNSSPEYAGVLVRFTYRVGTQHYPETDEYPSELRSVSPWYGQTAAAAYEVAIATPQIEAPLTGFWEGAVDSSLYLWFGRDGDVSVFEPSNAPAVPSQ